MNSKRQTVWLVSMLSLMVVLSAYYLFTDNVEDLDYASGNLQGDQVTLEHTETDGNNNNLDDPLLTLNGDGKTDAEILNDVDAISTWSADYFDSMNRERLDEFARKYDELQAQINTAEDTEEIDSATNVYNEINQMEQQYEIVVSMEERLMQDYENVFMSEEEGQWTVAVQADRLERSQAVTIVDMVAQELNVTPGNIVVQLK